MVMAMVMVMVTAFDFILLSFSFLFNVLVLILEFENIFLLNLDVRQRVVKDLILYLRDLPILHLYLILLSDVVESIFRVHDDLRLHLHLLLDLDGVLQALQVAIVFASSF